MTIPLKESRPLIGGEKRNGLIISSFSFSSDMCQGPRSERLRSDLAKMSHLYFGREFAIQPSNINFEDENI